MRLSSRLCLSLFCATLALPAFAQRQKSQVPDLDDASRKGDMARLAQQKANERFDAADENKDGVLSKEELGKHMSFIAENFERYDKNKDGVLSWEEFLGHDRWKRESKAGAAKSDPAVK